MSKQLKPYAQLSRQILLAHLQVKAIRFEEFDDFYKEYKDVFEDLKINKTEAYDFYWEVCEGIA